LTMSTVPAKDFVPKGRRELGACGGTEHATAAPWAKREHLCDTVKGGSGARKRSRQPLSADQSRELRREQRCQADIARIREIADDERLQDLQVSCPCRSRDLCRCTGGAVGEAVSLYLRYMRAREAESECFKRAADGTHLNALFVMCISVAAQQAQKHKDLKVLLKAAGDDRLSLRHLSQARKKLEMYVLEPENRKRQQDAASRLLSGAAAHTQPHAPGDPCAPTSVRITQTIAHLQNINYHTRRESLRLESVAVSLAPLVQYQGGHHQSLASSAILLAHAFLSLMSKEEAAKVARQSQEADQQQAVRDAFLKMVYSGRRRFAPDASLVEHLSSRSGCVCVCVCVCVPFYIHGARMQDSICFKDTHIRIYTQTSLY